MLTYSKSVKSGKKSFTLLEILITVAIIILLAVIVLLVLDPFQQINKANDAKRKNDLSILKKALEEWYNDKGCYPEPENICYDGATNYCNKPGSCTNFLSKSCNICGIESTSPSFLPYLSKLPCDPEHSKRKYLYEVEASCKDKVSSLTGVCCQTGCVQKKCAQWYRIYSNIRIKSDRDVADLGCQEGGCGLTNKKTALPTPPYGYEYGVTNINLEVSNVFHCSVASSCQTCGTYASCRDPAQSPGCINKPLYSSCQACCSQTGNCNPSDCP